MTALAKSALDTLVETLITSNGNGDISGEDLRNVLLPFLESSALFAFQDLTDAATVTWDAENGAGAILTLGGNRTISAVSNAQSGSRLMLALVQDSTGSRTVSWDDSYIFSSTPTLSTDPYMVDLFEFRLIDFGGDTGLVAIATSSMIGVLEYDPALGSELINNGDFANGTGSSADSWTHTNSSWNSGTENVSGPAIGGTPWTATHNSVSFDSTKIYRVAIDVSALSGTLNLQFNGTTDQTISSTGSHEFDISPTSTGLFRVQQAALESATFDNVSIKEIL